MAAETETRKNSDELLDIAAEMLLLLDKKHHLTEAETAMVIFLMGDCVRYVSEAEHIRRMMSND
ncbi:hypothetical protein LCGC14_1764790 [marine sediment metagenome]|uniref:Uncharacterized protein n=1 Tax=marine sediment metagenome TaxID=412755 RepID=A0A0F9JZP4_9ZZZZ